ncbi:AAA family ATPase [Shewanella chilikensis]|uniref:AAA family ATPase n=1 Tax=Shewanella chilikensis TaxID=558541 RepID=A0A6G7LNS5_9GAMM|nr:AAA family ATPase [Shewanella chilikensis]
MNKIKMEFKKLIIVGVEREYRCTFESGLNLIWGDLDSGKSSILNLIDFALGGKFGDLDNDEIKLYGRSVVLEVSINQKVITLNRVLGDKVNLIKVYECCYANINEHYPLLCSASSEGQEPDGWISDILLDYLAFHKGIFRRLPWLDKAQCYARFLTPEEHCLTGKFCPVVTGNLVGFATLFHQQILES